MPEPVTPQAPAPGTSTVPEGAQPPAPAAIAPERQAILDRYQAQYGNDPAAQPPVQTQPLAEPTPAQPPVAAAPDLAAELAAMRAELAALKQQPAPQVPTQPQAPVSQEPEADWLALLASGKKEDGEKALIAMLRKAIAPETQQAAVSEAINRFDAMTQVREYTTRVKSDPQNAEALRMEPYITAAVEQRLQQAQAAGKISTPADYVTVYRQAVDAEMAAARQLILTFRGEGAQQAAVRRTEVLSQPSLQPNQVDTQRQQAAPAEPQIETTQDYFQKRNAYAARMKGMA